MYQNLVQKYPFSKIICFSEVHLDDAPRINMFPIVTFDEFMSHDYFISNFFFRNKI